MLKKLADFILRLFGWRIINQLPAEKKLVLIGAPHTSNWDLPISLLIFWSTRKRIAWVAKKQIFVGPLGSLFRALGGIPVDRSAPTGFIDQIAEQMKSSESMILTIAPEGTRSKAKYWKSGFYYIAQAAEVPICLGYLDYPSRTAGFAGVIYPSGDLEKDFAIIRQHYLNKTGKLPHNQGEIKLRQR